MPVPPAIDAVSFRVYRLRAIYLANEAAFVAVAVLILAFTVWDHYVDAAHAGAALWVRLGGAALVIASGVFQRLTRRVEWSHWIAKFRLLVTSAAIAGALALLDAGFLVGLSGLIVATLGAAHSAIDRRDVIWLFLPPLSLAVAVMLVAGVETFVFVNATFFLGLTLLVALLLAQVLEHSHRRAWSAEQALLRESRLDALTGVANRRALEEQGQNALRHARRSGQPVSVLMIDLDRFKTVNDRHGHGVGDQVLTALAQRCRGLMRESDSFGRWGGEEFLALLGDTAPDAARELAERMRAAVAAAPMGETGVTLTISIGVAGMTPTPDQGVDEAWARLVGAADAAMYRAKTQGRNRVEGPP